MTVYAESSAVLAWLLGEDEGEEVRAVLANAELVCASDLTPGRVRPSAPPRCQRSAHHGSRFGLRRATLAGSAHHWALFRVSPEVAERARRPFPAEPVRTLDAIHLATALVARAAVQECDLLTWDDRVRRSAVELGFRVLPAARMREPVTG
jgi:hypothetical protein